MKNLKNPGAQSKSNDDKSAPHLNGVIFDARWIGDHGIGRFAKEISSRLKFTSNFTSQKNPAGLLSAVELGLWATEKKGTALYSPSYIPPILTSLPFSFTIHDLNHIDVAHNSSFLKRMYYKFIILPAINRACCVLTVSEFSKKRIINWSGCSPDKVKVVGNGVSAAFNIDVLPNTPGYAYLFCCSNRKGHKNEVRLLQAFKKSGLDNTKKLVFTGDPDTPTLNTIKELQLNNSVVFTGRVSEEELAGWYKGAIVTVFPSLYEGFGLPLIESMACGTPFIASNTTSLPEVGGEAGYYVDPMNIDSIADGMNLIVRDKELQERMRHKGLSRAEFFTWDRTASLVSDALKGMI